MYHKIEDYHLATSPCLKNSSKSFVGGVGLLLSPKAMENLSNIEVISPRVIIADFEGNPKTTTIICYSPHNNSSDADIDQFYNTLRSTFENVPAYNFLVILGDLNAKLGSNDTKFTFHANTNRNGEHLVDLMEEFNLCSANTKFMKSKHQLWTYEYPNGDRAQLDYILVRMKWQNSVKDCRAYSSFSSVGSDHRIVSAKVKLNFRVSKKTPADPMKTIDGKKVSRDKALSSQYAVSVFNRFQELSHLDSDNSHMDSGNIDSIYENLIKANEEVVLSTLPKKPKPRKNQLSSDANVTEARNVLRKISSLYHSHPSQTNKDKLIAAKNSLDNAYLEAEVAFINRKIDDISNHHINQQHSAAWKAINELSGKNIQLSIRYTATYQGYQP